MFIQIRDQWINLHHIETVTVDRTNRGSAYLQFVSGQTLTLYGEAAQALLQALRQLQGQDS